MHNLSNNGGCKLAYIAGIDGCRGAWIAAFKKVDDFQLHWKKCSTLSEILDVPDIFVIGIDIPIGLVEIGSRKCDVEVRKLLGSTRGSSVFPAPIRAVLNAGDYKRACDIRVRIEGKKMSKQAWSIVSKIREVDSMLKEAPYLRTLFYEVHPELSFYFMGGNEANMYSKKKKMGIQERIKKLSKYFNIDCSYVKTIGTKYGVMKDDVVDTLAALWSAQRILQGESRILPVGSNAEEAKIHA